MLDIKTKPNNNVEVCTSWIENIQENRLCRTIEAKYRLAGHNLALREKLNKDSFLNVEISYKSTVLKGLCLNFADSFWPRTGLHTGFIKAQLCKRFLLADSDFEIGQNFTFLTSSFVLGTRGILGGVQWKYDLFRNRQAELNFAVGCRSDNLHLYLCVVNGNEYSGSTYHEVSPDLEVGVNMKWWTKGPEPIFGVAGRFRIDRDVHIRGKINNRRELGLSYEQKLSAGIILTISALFNLKNFSSGTHKLGLGLCLELQ